MKNNNLLKITFIILITFFNSLVFGATDYTKYVNDISSRLNKAYDLYEKGDTKSSKKTIQLAYFEVFENLEGPIRINISAKKSYLMESQFGEMRKMVAKGVSKDELRRAIDNFIKEMDEVLPEITGGHELVAETSDGKATQAVANTSKTEKVLPTWQSAIDMINKTLKSAVQKYDPNNSIETRSLIQSAQFDGYRNSGLETAIRKYNSSDREAYIQNQFLSMIRFVHTKPTKEQLNKKVDELLADINEVAPNLGLVSNARVVKVKEEKVSKDYSSTVEDLYKVFDEAIIKYKKGQIEESISSIQDSYFDIFEGSGMENAVGAKNSTLKTNIEGHFGKMLSLIKNKSSIENINAEYSLMKSSIQKALDVLNDSKGGFISMFIYSLTIILREGFEALLIVTAIIAYLIKSGNSNRLNIVYSSLSVAVILSFVTAYIMNLVFGAAAAKNRELLEGIVMLVATGLLLYVSYWLISNATSKKWTNYIKQNVQNSLDSNSVKALWFTVFLAVYREGAETVLFYQALIVDASTKSEYMALISGFLVGIIGLVIIYAIMKFTAIKLPIKGFFMGTGIFIYVMTFIFVGKGIMELVEGKLFIPTPIESMPTITTIGIYPYWQTVLPQIAILLIGVWGVIKLRQKTA